VHPKTIDEHVLDHFALQAWIRVTAGANVGASGQKVRVLDGVVELDKHRSGKLASGVGAVAGGVHAVLDRAFVNGVVAAKLLPFARIQVKMATFDRELDSLAHKEIFGRHLLAETAAFETNGDVRVFDVYLLHAMIILIILIIIIANGNNGGENVGEREMKKGCAVLAILTRFNIDKRAVHKGTVFGGLGFGVLESMSMN
jgi:hypothetical protein